MLRIGTFLQRPSRKNRGDLPFSLQRPKLVSSRVRNAGKLASILTLGQPPLAQKSETLLMKAYQENELFSKK